MFRLIGVCFFTLILSGCGTVQHDNVGLEEPAKLVIRSESLVGATISIQGITALTVTKKDLAKYKTGVLGVADRTNEKLETVVIEVREGMQRVTVSHDGYTAYDQDLYVGKGQTRELRIKK